MQGKNAESSRPDLFLVPPFGDFTGAIDLDIDEVSCFRRIIYGFYEERGRKFPWRDTRDPYEILVSEIMLQQTQTGRVLPKYQEFLSHWPDVATLAGASLSDVYSVWKGLGYNKRAKALVDIAKEVSVKYGGMIPRSERDLRFLPMVGQATAAAVQAFAFDIPVVYLETNIRKVFLYFFFSGRTGVYDREIRPIACSALDNDDPRQWSYALMDYGAHLRALMPNPNRRSAHYTKQAPFENSNRQIRGSILRRLSETGPEPPGEIASALRYDADRTAKCLEQLRAEGLLVSENGKYGFPD